MWVIRCEAWEELLRHENWMQFVGYRGIRGQRNSLYGLPVRLTIDDAEDVPMIQLVMEPMLFKKQV
jgi:hypothetical protein